MCTRGVTAVWHVRVVHSVAVCYRQHITAATACCVASMLQPEPQRVLFVAGGVMYLYAK